jgi:hypothetical protein
MDLYGLSSKFGTRCQEATLLDFTAEETILGGFTGTYQGTINVIKSKISV